MKIMQIIYSYDLGGIEKVSLLLSKYFADNKVNNSIVTLSKSENINWCDTQKKIARKTSNLIDLSSYKRIVKLTKLIKLIIKEKPEILIIHHEKNTIRIILPALIVGCKIVQVQHNTKINDSFVHRHIVKYFVSRYIGVSSDVSIKLITKLHIPSKKVETITNGIDIASYSSKYERINECLTIVSAGRFCEQKNYINLAKGFLGFLKVCQVPVKIIMAGSGPLYDDVKDMVNQYDQIILPGSVSNMPEFFQSADIYVSFSLYEGFSLTLLEAMASSCAVLTSITSGSSELIVDEQNGYLINQNDQDALISRLLLLTTDVNIRNKIGKSGKESIYSYDFSRTGNEYMTLFRKITNA